MTNEIFYQLYWGDRYLTMVCGEYGMSPEEIMMKAFNDERKHQLNQDVFPAVLLLYVDKILIRDSNNPDRLTTYFNKEGTSFNVPSHN